MATFCDGGDRENRDLALRLSVFKPALVDEYQESHKCLLQGLPL